MLMRGVSSRSTVDQESPVATWQTLLLSITFAGARYARNY
jgi:hypothetical protein